MQLTKKFFEKNPSIHRALLCFLQCMPLLFFHMGIFEHFLCHMMCDVLNEVFYKRNELVLTFWPQWARAERISSSAQTARAASTPAGSVTGRMTAATPAMSSPAVSSATPGRTASYLVCLSAGPSVQVTIPLDETVAHAEVWNKNFPRVKKIFMHDKLMIAEFSTYLPWT